MTCGIQFSVGLPRGEKCLRMCFAQWQLVREFIALHEKPIVPCIRAAQGPEAPKAAAATGKKRKKAATSDPKQGQAFGYVISSVILIRHSV